MPMVLILTGVLVAATGAFLVEILGSSRAGYMILKRKQAFYVADGVARVVGQITQSHLNQMDPSARDTLLGNPDALEQTILDLVCKAGNGSLQDNPCCHNPNLQDANGCCDSDMLKRFTPAMHNVQCLKVEAPSVSVAGSIPGGPFQGMQSDLVSLTIDIQVVRHITGTLPLAAGNISASSNTKQQILIGDVSAFQFANWTYGDASLYFGPDMILKGRNHINGNFCVGGNGLGDANNQFTPVFNQGPYVEQVTVAGNLYLLGASECVQPSTFNSQLAVSTVPDFSTFNVLDYDSREEDWLERSNTDFDSNIRDAAHGIFELQLPANLRLSGNPRVMHDGYNTLASIEDVGEERFLALNNIDTSTRDTKPGGLRYVSEPVYDHIAFADPEDIRRQKMAYKSDIRIINGIWFVRNEPRGEETNWPGVPIWSDHPGTYKAKGPKIGSGQSAIGTEFGFLPKSKEYNVGQTDLAGSNALGWTDIPKRYSYYRWNPNTFTPWSRIDAPDVPVTPAVISYGSLFRQNYGSTAVGTVWRPGYYSFDNSFCDASQPLKAFDTLDGTFISSSSPSATCEIDTELFGNREFLGILLGARSGFQNSQLYVNSNPKVWLNSLGTEPANRKRVSAVYPINFDVNAFQEALASEKAGELGWIITKIIPEEEFNGIIYIASSWPGIVDDLKNKETAHPALAPLAYEENSVAPTTRKFPYALCGEQDRALPTGGTPPLISKCSTAYLPQMNNPSHLFPNALRIVNGRNLMNSHRTDAATQPYLPALSDAAKNSAKVRKLAEGLTIATNLPVYMLGDFNRNSYPPSSEAGDHVAQSWFPCEDLDDNGAGTDCWISTSIVGDNITLLSNDWSDAKSPINGEPVNTLALRAVTAPAVYNTSFLAGWTPSAKTGPSILTNGGLNNFPKFIEMWESNTFVKQKAFIRGSFVVGWASAHIPAGWSCCAPVFTPPERQWKFDARLHQPNAQPPGAPLLNIFSLSQWVRDQ
ncbi:MAG: hypothetical protein CMH56_17395 [Myxococcales bacterium]|nr:hypothetical protein [Myxococcales bacterium]